VAKHLRIKVGEFTFIFKYETEHPELLHIYAQHLMQPKDAIDTFFEGAEDKWDEQHKRFETSTESITILWFWKVQDEVVYIISCYRNY
jgi:hypothetical protein